MNIKFEQKLIAEELADTMFFSTGSRCVMEKTTDGPMLSIGKLLFVSCGSFKHIRVNGYRAKSVDAAKKIIMGIADRVDISTHKII